ncbi:hypothetical protein GH714_014638 [Hevea brasiliensis]|uniref:Myb/SANT-like domain-containing protein n=1 Tax=Hevea brasiliensis TaxID=3981 RepID=A0A6A6K4S8_HEVBR|nr:hypothetical protein GH714_014638 [Hevea brasiliensis]
MPKRTNPYSSNANASNGHVTCLWSNTMDDALIDTYLNQHMLGNKAKPEATEWRNKPVRNYEKLVKNAFTLENLNECEDEYQDAPTPNTLISNAQSEASNSKSKKSKKSDNDDLAILKEGLDNVASAINSLSNKPSIRQSEIWQLVSDLGF